MSGNIVGCHNCVWRSPRIQWVETRAAAGLLPPMHPHKAPASKFMSLEAAAWAGWFRGDFKLYNNMVFLLGALPPRSLARNSYHPLMFSLRPPLRSSCTAGEGLPLWLCQDLDQASCPAQPPQATQARRMEAHNHHGCLT